jgi:hypothetical protein
MKRRRRAYQQGDLDGFCGVYSVVNALRYLLHLNNKQCRELFRALIKALGETSRRPHNLLARGILFTQLGRLVITAAQFRFDERDCSFHARVLRLGPEESTLPCLWAALEQEVGPACMAIVGTRVSEPLPSFGIVVSAYRRERVRAAWVTLETRSDPACGRARPRSSIGRPVRLESRAT